MYTSGLPAHGPAPADGPGRGGCDRRLDAGFNEFEDEWLDAALLKLFGADDSKLDFSFGALLEAEGSIDMTLDPGKNGTGEIGYEVDPNWQTLEIKFTPELFGSESYTFTFSRSDLGI